MAKVVFFLGGGATLDQKLKTKSRGQMFQYQQKGLATRDKHTHYEIYSFG